jgi:hypothetical protein
VDDGLLTVFLAAYPSFSGKPFRWERNMSYTPLVVVVKLIILCSLLVLFLLLDLLRVIVLFESYRANLLG